MAQIAYRGNLSSATFPMTVADAGRSVIIPGSDNVYDRRVDPAGEGKDAGIPQAIYMENVLPTPGGYQSAGFESQAHGLTIAGRTILTTIKLDAPVTSPTVGSDVSLELVLYTNNTADWNYSDDSGLWTAATFIGAFTTAFATEDNVSVGRVRNTLYLWIRTELYTVTLVTGILVITNVTASLVGIFSSQISYITSAFNYLIAASDYGLISWSSTTTPTDFAASLVSGAGSETPGMLRGQIKHIAAHPTGFFIYCSSNVISVQYTGNARYPWKFREISNSGGYLNKVQIAGDLNSFFHVGLDITGKVQIVEPAQATIIASEVSTFLERLKHFDSFNYGTNVFSLVTLITEAYTGATTLVDYQLRRVWNFLDRYICISYGSAQGVYQYVIIYDQLLQRYGKLKHTHSYIFCNEKYLFFLNYSTGAVHKLSYDIYDADITFASVLVLGKFQYVRSRFIQLEELELESSQQSSLITPNFVVAILPSLDGKNFDASVTPTSVLSNAALRTYACHTNSQNVSIVVKGAFDLNTIVLKFSPGGKR